MGTPHIRADQPSTAECKHILICVGSDLQEECHTLSGLYGGGQNSGAFSFCGQQGVF